MHVERFRVTHVIAAPDAADQLLSGEHAALIAHQVFEHLEFLERELGQFTVNAHFVRGHRHLDGPACKRLIVPSGCSRSPWLETATQHRMDPGEQFAEGVRFGHIVVGTDFEPYDHMILG